MAWVVGGLVVVLAACTSAPSTELPPSVRAVRLLEEGHCGACHQIPGVPGATGDIGPDLCEVAARYARGEITVTDIMADIIQPNRRVHEGYLDDIMPNDYGERFSTEELRLMAEYLARLPCVGATPTATPSLGGG
ncbi:MAG: c-type cytochrome [Chloroflexi bacterium]|nr:c-type cytochrome [Chloroflexota bacterium]